MRAVTWVAPGEVGLAEMPRPTLQGPGDAILRVRRAAVCGSDLHALHGKLPRLAPGTVLGHEFSGVVEEAGPAVSRLREGERCVAAMHVACGRCEGCLAGRYSRCPEYAMFGLGEMMGGLAGGQAEYVRVPQADMTLCPIPEGMDDESALFTGDILATAYSGCQEAGIRPGDVVAVVGAGPVGLLTLQCAALFGPSALFALDPIAERRGLAESMGATALDPGGEAPQQMRDLAGGRRADVVIDAVGTAASAALAWRLVERGGTLALVGLLVAEDWPQSMGQTWLRNLTVRTVVGQPYRHRQRLLRLIQGGRLRPRAIISESLPLEQAARAYSDMDSRRTLKPLLLVS